MSAPTVPLAPTLGAAKSLAHVAVWVFDLDNTLYPPDGSVFPQIDRRIRDYIAAYLGVDPAEAYRIQKHFFHTYGTSLLGMTREHGAEPRAFLNYVHDIDLTVIATDLDLRAALERLPGRKLVFTNADAAYATRVLHRIGIADCFEAIFDIEAAGFLPKPHAATYQRLLAAHRIDPATAALLDDLPRNLAPAAALGMTTIWVKNDAEWVTDAGVTPDHTVERLGAWLHAVATRGAIDTPTAPAMVPRQRPDQVTP